MARAAWWPCQGTPCCTWGHSSLGCDVRKPICLQGLILFIDFYLFCFFLKEPSSVEDILFG